MNDDKDDIDPQPLAHASRRGFLARMGAATAGAIAAPAAALAQDAKNLPPHVPEWTKAQGRGFLTPPYGLPSPFEKGVVRVLPSAPGPFPTATRTPLQNLKGTITPNGLFFERHHAGVPMIDPREHRLMVHGLVDRPLVFTMEELVRLPAVSRIHFIECSGNSAAEWTKASGRTAQEVHGLLSNAEWTGVPLAVLLHEAGVQPAARWLLCEGADAAAMTRSVPIEKAMDDAIVAYAQNGEMLRPEQGYPLRLLLPGYEGNMNIKWLRRIKLGTEPWHTREETSAYTDVMPDGTARQFTFLMDAKSCILSPSGGQRLGKPGYHEICGVAWSGRGRIAGVEVSVDGGRTWKRARLQEPVLARALTAFRADWHWDGNPAILQSRAIDETGYVQPTRSQLVAVRGTASFYHYNGIQSWSIDAKGEVTNVHA
ncbi:MAG: sulfite dehydrogenase [Betaproteobacteria bacterium]